MPPSVNTTSSLAMPITDQGLVLTRRAQDTKKGIELTYWLKTAQGRAQLVVSGEQALFFVKTSDSSKAKTLLLSQQVSYADCKDLPLKTFDGVTVSAFYFDYLRDFYAARELLKQHVIKCYEDDIRPEERYLMERFITSQLTFSGVAQATMTYPLYSDVRCKQADFDTDLVVVSVDLECSPKGELYSIGIDSEGCQRVFMIGQAIEPCPDYMVWVEDEIALLYAFIDWVNDYDPDIIIGWNVVHFDFNLLQKRCDLNNIPFRIGRDGSEPYWRQLKSTDQKFIEIAGRVVLDGIDVLKTATYHFASFSLDNVATELLGKKKKVKDVENRLAEIVHNFHHDKLSLAAYNLEDCVLVSEIFEKTELIAFAKLRAQLTGLTLDRVGGSVAAFTNLYLPKLHRAGYVAPNLGDGHSSLVSPGGYVMDSTPGLFRNVLVLDFKSLYPSIIRTFKIDPMGLIEGLKEPDEAIEGFDGALFSRTKNFLPDIITHLWHARDKAKAEKNAALSQAIKIIMNSFYGVLGSSGCRFYDPRLSGSITKRSHQILKTTQQWIEAKGHKVIYGDTDSIFVHVGDDTKPDVCKALGHEMAEFINSRWQETIKENYKENSQLEIEFETHFTSFFMPKIRGIDAQQVSGNLGTKKRYAGLCNDKLVFKGLETVRSDWTGVSKIFQQELYRRIFNDLPVATFIRETVQQIKQGEHDEQLVFTKKIRRKLDDYVNTPPHIKAALIANQRSIELQKKPPYKRGSKIHYVMTFNGIQPLEFQSSGLDYDFYVEKQIKPIADDVLPFIGEDFNRIISAQYNLFE